LESNVVEEMDLTSLVNPTEKMLEAREERRWSKRVLKITEDAEKAKKMSGKSSCEGNNILPNSFSILGSEEIINRSIAMGVKVDNNSFVNINIITEMEKARHALQCKTKNMNENDVRSIGSDSESAELDSSSIDLNHITNDGDRGELI
jgi:hypothetical protein